MKNMGVLFFVGWCLLFHFLGAITYDTAWLSVVVAFCTKEIIESKEVKDEN